MIKSPANPAAVADTYRHWTGLRTGAAIAQLCSLLRDGVHGGRDEIDKLDFWNRSHTHHRRTDRRTDDDALGKRGVDNSIAPKLIQQTLRSLEGTAHLAYVLDRKSTRLNS